MPIDEVDREFARLLNKLKQLEQFRRVELSQDRNIAMAVKWLKNHQHPEGYWGYESIADTGLVLLALAIYDDPSERNWNIKEKYVGGVNLAVSWLKTQWELNRWEGNLWDASICVQALLRLDMRQKWVLGVVEWIKETAIQHPSKYKFHHLAQAINALVLNGLNADAEIVAVSLMNRLASSFSSNSRVENSLHSEIIMDAYVIGQVLDALVNAGVRLHNNMIISLANSLRRFLENSANGLSEGTFQNVMMAFMGLASFLGGEDDNLISSVIAEIFRRPDRFKADGSWYHDAKKTAFALLGLSRIKAVRKIEAFPSRIYSLLSEYQRTVTSAFEEQERFYKSILREVRKGYYWLALSLSAIILSLTLALWLGTSDFFVQTLIGALLTTLMPSSMLKAIVSFKARSSLKEEINEIVPA